MSTMIEIDPTIRVRVLEMQVARAEAELEARMVQLVEMIDERNQLMADRERLRRMNGDLLRRMDALQGYPERLLLVAE